MGCNPPAAQSEVAASRAALHTVPIDFHPESLMETYGTLPDGREARIFTLENRNGLRARVTEYGAILVSLEAPDRDGNLADVTLGYDSLAGWLTNNSYLGATVGRFGNRIRDGKFTLDGKEYALAKNNTPGGIPCHLHGGIVGFDKVLWKGEQDGNKVVFTYVSPAGEEGYPGTVTTRVTYTLTDDNELKWEAEATTDAPTILNLVHHTYWNLSGDPSTSILNHVMKIESDAYLPTDAGLIPTGELAPVANTPLDFTKPTVVGDRIDADFEALTLAGGYDHCWVVRGKNGTVRPAARVSDPVSGRFMEVSSDQPAIQFYAGNFLDGTAEGRNGVRYARRSGLCLETENFPDAPNQPSFPSSVLRPGETYRHVMIHRFGAE
jgi:aldose 1-epimerase